MKKNGMLKSGAFLLFLAFITGIIFGLIMKMLPSYFYVDDILINGIMKFLGNGFINLIKMTVVPLVFVSLICGISSFGDTKKLGRIGFKTVLLFIVSTTTAVITSLLFASIFKPGCGLNLGTSTEEACSVSASAQNIVDIFINIIPSNPIESMSNGNLLQVLVFAVFFGISISSVGGEKAKKLTYIFESINECMMKIVTMTMKVAPIGVFALISTTVYSTGLNSLLGVLKMIFVTIGALIVHSLLFYGSMIKIGGKLSIIKFFKKYSKIASITFSTASSNAAVPASMTMMEDIGIEKSVYRFVIPLGATVHMAGTAIYQGITAVFISQAYGVELSPRSIVTILISALLASVGTAGVPGMGMIMVAMVLSSVGLPAEGIALIFGVDRIIDMVKTTVNVLGDCVCCVVVAKSENMIENEEKYNELI